MLPKMEAARTGATAALVAIGISCTALAEGGIDGASDELVSVGVARIEITPEEPIRLTGYLDRRTPSDSVVLPLYAEALAFGTDDEGPAVIVTADLIGIPWALREQLAGRLERVGVTGARLVVGATHTHTGPSLVGVLPNPLGEPIPAEQQAVIERYTEALVGKLEQVALAALADRRPARLGWTQGRVGFAANRRVLENGRWARFGVSPDGPVDHALPILSVRDPEGQLRAVWLNYAAHATTLVSRDNFVHGDWPGAAKELIARRHPGAIALVTIGAGADADPQPRGNGVRDVGRNAEEIADEVDRLLAGEMLPLRAAPIADLRVLQLSLEPIPSRARLEERALQDGIDGMFARIALERLRHNEALTAGVAYPVQTWTFGADLAMVFLAGEVVVDYALRLKNELDASRLWVIAYANDVAFYVPSRRVLAEGGYEAERSMIYYGHPSRLTPVTEDLIVRSVHELLPADYAARGEARTRP